MQNILIAILISSMATVAFADGHSNNEEAVLAALDKY